MNGKLFLALSSALLLVAMLSVQIGNGVDLVTQWQLLWAQREASSFAEFNFLYGQLPRLVMTLLVGAMLGLVGSVMQQLTQNNLTSPLTLGTSSGAWLALIILNIGFPSLVASYSALVAMSGALLAFALIVVIAGVRNMTGLPLIVAGMVVNLLLGAIATALILLNEQYAKNVFMWGAGDLAQNGWDWVQWLLPRLSVSLLILLFAPRVLTLLRLGHQGAAARGLPVIPAFLILMVLGIWLVSASITAVGVISFIGLLTPNIARAMGARTPKQELYSSLLLGALLLLLTDMLAMWLSLWTTQVIASGITAAAIGAPALIWFSRRQLKAQDTLTISLPQSRASLSRVALLGLLLMMLAALGLHTLFQMNELSWQLALPSSYQWSLRWPRMLTALCAGIGLALAGSILQRLIYNPLASPDILGVSSGATFALVFANLFLGQSLLAAHWVTALLGSLLVLAALVVLGKRHQYAASSLILTGIAITALLESLVQFCLAKGSEDSYRILQWLAGSTYRVTPDQALLLAVLVLLLAAATIALSRWLTLISIGRRFASARGVNAQSTSLILLTIVALLCTLVTATMGPVSFVGLIAPHMAMMLGAQQSKTQLLVASLVGASLMLWADWLGQVIVYPMQIAAGTLVAILGGSYFLLLLLVNRSK
ncbi:Fe(3+)-hydroxamate ABC transporter permease FhuB [Vibrio anguillarum]|uniref:Fe(3+)-hydroxamate ABC transporter permease FhuB n=1 Tax=Vibrio anguillarum TaxID=55601 RepID=A0A289GDW0_VIBAN|nr:MULTISPECIES: Fe(3+)-hydroxamate ABC transporter permease FhuB [Vibrio]ASW82247.1 Fe(3+)-hydroxamate ABC transporter permease FhuB [Vibrio anguillarum]AXN02980.1 Fe(3+)-hydroxamate ABC transporter permease FhuB [Vibrio anguillarum]AZS24796.1 Fe(3+)-hydroxamate ABC transporter permease FhuB [Vibrio anguillarum]MBF4309569.1 Fe(3+)-hydroxamate ABC transporter permease FhuB [Vibrio anguillarum]MBF4326972.1 Fe(3+)-hydroxamate ABC transporter permease FhuB [Vibrio anguillarum]